MRVDVERVQASPRGHVQLIPNIDRSGRPLPETVSADEVRANARTDREMPVRRLRDPQLCSIVVDVSAAELAARPALALEVHFAAGLFRVLDKSGIPLKAPAQGPLRIPLAPAKKDNTKARGIQFFLEAQTFWGSPLVAEDAPRSLFFRFVDGDQVVLTQTSFGGSDLRTADVVLLGDDAPPQRLYVCDVGENRPSLREIADGARRANVPLTVVPLAVNLGDSWMQDQFQLGYTATREGAQQVIVHLPRMGHDLALVPGTPNLRNFVDGHFPSEGVGVVKDFWQPKLTVTDGATSLELGVAESYVMYKALMRVVRLLTLMHSLIRKIDKRADPRVPGGDLSNLFAVRLAIDDAHARLLAYRTVTAEQQTLILALKRAVDAISSVLARNGETVELVGKPASGETRTLVFTRDNQIALQAYFNELHDTHSSHNYGGNIEVSPPYAEAPYGKILTGSLSSQPLKAFLTSRGSRHPLASVYTKWLEVGHIDEIAAFADRGNGSFAILRAAPMLAIAMLERAVALQKSGKLVTRLFRGKKWTHQAAAGSPDTHAPPAAYAALLARDGPYDLKGLGVRIDRSTKDPYGHAAFHDDRQFLVFSRRPTVDARYAAFVPCADLLATCRATNRAVDALFLANDYRYADELAYRPYYDSQAYREEGLPYRLDTVLAKEFRGVPVRPLPFLFDRVDDFLHAGTKAVIPGTVNLQTLGRVALVPRPYGPRLRVADAIALVAEFLVRPGGVSTVPDAQYVRSRGLDKTWHWTRKAERVERAAIGRWPTPFDVDYDEMNRSDALSVAVSTTSFEVMSLYRILHGNDPLANHPVAEPENLYRIAGYFKDGFDEFRNLRVDYCEGDTEQSHPRQDQYEKDIRTVMERIRNANPDVFDKAGNVLAADWRQIAIPEDTVDVFELYTELVLESAGMTVQWVDSWYYHVHSGGIHCGTNVLRRR